MSTPAKDTLDVWPALPLVIQYRAYLTDNTITVLERGDRMCQIDLMDFAFGKGFGSDAELQQKLFLELTYLLLWLKGKTVTALPDSFLGGSAPRVDYLELDCRPFPVLYTGGNAYCPFHVDQAQPRNSSS